MSRVVARSGDGIGRPPGTRHRHRSRVTRPTLRKSAGESATSSRASIGCPPSRSLLASRSLAVPQRLLRRPLRRVLRVSSSSSFVPRLDRCLKPVEIHIFEVRAAQLFVVSFVEPVEPNGIEDLPEWSSVAKDPDERSFGGGAVHLERNGHEMLRLGPSCSKILSRLLRSPRPYAVA